MEIVIVTPEQLAAMIEAAVEKALEKRTPKANEWITYDEIVEKYNVPIGTVRNRVCDAKSETESHYYKGHKRKAIRVTEAEKLFRKHIQ